MTCYHWHFDPDGWPHELIDSLTGRHVPVFTGQSEEMLPPQDGERPLVCIFPRTSGVAGWDWA